MKNSIYLNTEEIAKKLGFSYQKALDFVKFSGVNYSKIGKVYRVRADILDKFLEENTNIDLKEEKYNASVRTYTKKNKYQQRNLFSDSNRITKGHKYW